MEKSTVINLIGAPGAGKSTLASKLFSGAKTAGLDVELVSEYAKELVWEERKETFKDELYLFAKQNHRMFRLNGKVKYIVTDRPLILSQFYNSVYGDKSAPFKNIVLHEIEKYENIYIFVERVKPYNPKGRNETDEESKAFSEQIKAMLEDLKIPYITATESSYDYIWDNSFNNKVDYFDVSARQEAKRRKEKK